MRTEFGKIIEDKNGYFIISTNEKGFRGKKLHRLLYCKYNNCTLEDIEGMHIHHIDGDNHNNEQDNLVAISPGEHTILHHKNKIVDDETRLKISKFRQGLKASEETKRKMSKIKNTSGYRNVYKNKNKRYKQGFKWRYQYYEDGIRKTIERVNIDDLKEVVIERGLPWEEYKGGLVA